MPRSWRLRSVDPTRAGRLADALGVHPVVAQLLLHRGAETVEASRRFLDRRLSQLHDPRLLAGVEDAARRVHEAVNAGKKICIYGDYDVDGMCASAILLECLRVAGAKCRPYVPDRFEEGYGVHADALRRIREDGTDLVITVDCGIGSVEEANLARELGLEYIVTDHHEFHEHIPSADAVVHPRLDGGYPFGELCGTGVAFKLAWEIARQFSGGLKTTDRFQKFLLDATSLAAVGTVCDMVPLADENRVLVHHGLKSLKQSPSLGIARLMEVTGLDRKSQLDAQDIGFTLGPRLNACGRLGQARLGVELLTTRDETRAQQLARYLDDENKVRQTLERRILQQARAMIEEEGHAESPVIVVGREDWHGGVIGIVASRIVERYQRPCILVAIDHPHAAGSGRSVPGFHLQQALADCGEYLVGSGGHAMAAGLRIEPERIAPFREALCDYAKTKMQRAQFDRPVEIDMEIPLHILTLGTLRAFEVLEPFGHSNPPPVFLATNLKVDGEPKRVGGGERHLSFRVRQGTHCVRAIAFDQADRADDLVGEDGACCLVFSPSINEFRGKHEVQMRVLDFRPGARVVESTEASPCPIS